MATVEASSAVGATLADVLQHLGDISPSRIRFRPALGTATEADVPAIHDHEGRLYELVDGILVEKGMGFLESLLAAALIALLRAFVLQRRLGIVTGEAGTMRLAAGLVRIPDVAFIAWERLPNRRILSQPIPDVVPNLAVEVLSVSNTAGEMLRKRQEYFDASVQLLWQIDPQSRTVEVFTSPEHATFLHAAQTLDGGSVLPGFSLPLHTLFAELDLQGEA